MPILRGGIEKARQAQAGIDHKARRRLAAACQFALQHVVHENGGQAEIAQEIMHPAPAAVRHQQEIDRHGGNHDIAVDLAVEDQGVRGWSLIGIVGGQRLGARAAWRRRRPGPDRKPL